MKIGLLVGIVLVLVATIAYATALGPVTPEPPAPWNFTHAVTIVGGEPVEAAHALYLNQGEPIELSITAPWPEPESETDFYKLTPAHDPANWDTTYTITYLPGGGWGITTMWPGPESETDFDKLTGPVPIVIHTLSVLTATERASWGMNRSWGLEMYPGIPERLKPGDYPPPPPSDEFVEQIIANPGTPDPPQPGGQTITDTASNGEASLHYEP